MSTCQISFTRNFLPATLKRNSNGWNIEYYARHSDFSELQRVRIKLNRERKRYARIKDFYVYTNNIITEINQKLAQGWNPFTGTYCMNSVYPVIATPTQQVVYREIPQAIQVSEMTSTISTVQQEAEKVADIPTKKISKNSARKSLTIDELGKLYLKEKGVDVRADTMRSYKSFCHQFGNWCKKIDKKMLASNVTQAMAIDYVDECYLEQKISKRTYNNKVKQGRALFAWAVEKCYVEVNPFEKIKLKKVDEKKRTIVDEESRKKIVEYLESKDSNFLTVLQLVNVSLIRPKEIRNLRIRDVKLAERAIVIRGENAKNHHERYSALSPQVMERLLNMHLERYPEDYYLFGSDFMPSEKRCPDAKFTKTWQQLRETLHLPQEMQLYSLRDTGIFELLKSGVDSLSVMQHAGHRDLSMTTRYANHQDVHLTEKIYQNAVEF